MFYDDIKAPKIRCPCGDCDLLRSFFSKSYIDLRPTGVRKYWRLCRGRLQRDGKKQVAGLASIEQQVSLIYDDCVTQLVLA